MKSFFPPFMKKPLAGQPLLFVFGKMEMDRREIYYTWIFGTTKISMPGQMPAIRSSMANLPVFQRGSRGGYPLEAFFLGG